MLDRHRKPIERLKRGAPTAFELARPTARVVGAGHEPAHVQHMVCTPADRAVVAGPLDSVWQPRAPSVDARVTRVFGGR